MENSAGRLGTKMRSFAAEREEIEDAPSAYPATYEAVAPDASKRVMNLWSKILCISLRHNEKGVRWQARLVEVVPSGKEVCCRKAVAVHLEELLADALKGGYDVDGVGGDFVDVGGEMLYGIVGLRGLGHGGLGCGDLLRREDGGRLARGVGGWSRVGRHDGEQRTS